ncbi:MAG: hypothetical protein IPH16_18185 [Haliscomenobacter sp.]|nr:hypothetical protein [Haliscomenobacter sp.]
MGFYLTNADVHTMSNLRITAVRLFVLSFLALSLFSTPALYAQTPAETLEKGVKEYNALRDYIRTWSPKTLTDEGVSNTKSRMDQCIALLEPVLKSGNQEETRVARYFIMNAQYEYSFILGMKGENAEALDVMKGIEKDFSALKAADFPMRYVLDGKNFVIKWENFGSTQAEFLTGLGEVAYNMAQYDYAARILRLATIHPSIVTWLKYISYNKLIDVSEKSPSILKPEEVEDFALQALVYYHELDTAYKKTVQEFNYPKALRGMRILLKAAERTNAPVPVFKLAKGAEIGARYEADNAQVLQLYDACYRKSYAGDAAFHRNAEDYAQKCRVADPALARSVALAALQALSAVTPATDCGGLDYLAFRCRHWKLTDLEAAYLKKAASCNAEREKEARQLAKASKRSDSGFDLYLGAHLLPMLKSSDKRDLGGVVNFAGRRTAWEFSYLQVKNNKENIFDLWIREVEDADQDNISPWDGFKAHVHPKFFSSRGSEFAYVGLLLGYADKNFDPKRSPSPTTRPGFPPAPFFSPALPNTPRCFPWAAYSLPKGSEWICIGRLGRITTSLTRVTSKSTGKPLRSITPCLNIEKIRFSDLKSVSG